MCCRRRYTDFEWLRDVLTKTYPGIYIPPLPRKTLDEYASDEKIEKRMRMLTRFLNSLISDPLLRNSEVLYQFLSLENTKSLDSQLKNYENLQENISLPNCHTRSGKIVIDQGIENNLNLFNIINSNMNENVAELTKLSKSFKMLFNEINAVSKRYIEISKIFNNLYTLSMKNGENENLIKSYTNMKRLMEGLGYNELKLAKNIELEVREYFKYVRAEYFSTQELYEKYFYRYNLYEKHNQNLMKRKENLYNKKDTSKWELDPNEHCDISNKQECMNKMLKKDTIANSNMRELFLYYGNQCKNEFIRLREVVGYQNREKMREFYKDNYKVLEELNSIWETFGGC